MLLANTHREDKKGITITNGFQELLHKSYRKPNKI